MKKTDRITSCQIKLYYIIIIIIIILLDCRPICASVCYVGCSLFGLTTAKLVYQDSFGGDLNVTALGLIMSLFSFLVFTSLFIFCLLIVCLSVFFILCIVDKVFIKLAMLCYF